MLVGFSTV